MKHTESSFTISPDVQYRTVQELIEKSRPDFSYYALLSISSVIITAGLLLNNTAIVIGGMLVTPLLTPVLVIALGFSVGDLLLVGRVSKFLIKSFFYVFVLGVLLTVLFGAPQEFTLIHDSLRTSLLYFIVAIAAGGAATLAWIQKEISEVLPGVAIAVSLVPPLAMVGVGFGSFQFDLASTFFSIFALNIFGILMGSLIVFSLSRFNQVESVVHQKNEKLLFKIILLSLKKQKKKNK